MTPALAQQRPAATVSSETLLGDVVVTATRQSDTANRVALTITAQTQQALDQQVAVRR